MATHSSIPTWEIPWTEEPGGLHSVGLQELDMTEVTEHTHTHTHNLSASPLLVTASHVNNL